MTGVFYDIKKLKISLRVLYKMPIFPRIKFGTHDWKKNSLHKTELYLVLILMLKVMLKIFIELVSI